MENIRLRIPGMKSLHCQMTVSNAIKNVGGIVTHIEPTVAEIAISDNLTKAAIVQEIEKAGYQVANS